MMKQLFFTAVLVLLSVCLTAQEWKADMSYKYLYSKQWDKAVQIYNLSRPFIDVKQPLLMNGLNVSVSRIGKSSKKIRHGINLSYSYFRSYAENESFNNKLKLYFLNVGYIIQYEKSEKPKSIYADMIVSLSSSGLFRRVNGEAFVYDEKKSKAFGIGGELSLKCGYRMIQKTRFHLSPFVLVSYAPYLYSPNTEAVINQTKGMLHKNWTGILSAQIGISIHLKKEKTGE